MTLRSTWLLKIKSDPCPSWVTRRRTSGSTSWCRFRTSSRTLMNQWTLSCRATILRNYSWCWLTSRRKQTLTLYSSTIISSDRKWRISSEKMQLGSPLEAMLSIWLDSMINWENLTNSVARNEQSSLQFSTTYTKKMIMQILKSTCSNSISKWKEKTSLKVQS